MKKVEWEEWANPHLLEEVRKYGKFDTNACLSCGGCTITCALSSNETSFSPRQCFQYIQAGLRERLLNNLGPWLCYYCGDCSVSCPREAEPGESMMTLRRYLTANYDWTGFAKKVYTSKIFEIAAILIIALVVVALYFKFTFFPSGDAANWIGDDGGVLINKIAPWTRIHLGDWFLAGVLAFLLITNVFYMWLKIIVKDKSVNVPFKTYITEIFSLIWNFFTQRRFNKCDNSKTYWILHLCLMLSYVMLFTIIVFFLEWFQTDTVHPVWHPQRLLGYIATIGLFAGIIYFIYARIKKSTEISKNSHFTDWTFLILLLLTTLSGILLHFARVSGLPVYTYIMYLIHLMVLVPMLAIEVPFSKWSHLAYRPFAIYFYRVKEEAYRLQQQKIDELSLKEAA